MPKRQISLNVHLQAWGQFTLGQSRGENYSGVAGRDSQGGPHAQRATIEHWTGFNAKRIHRTAHLHADEWRFARTRMHSTRNWTYSPPHSALQVKGRKRTKRRKRLRERRQATGEMSRKGLHGRRRRDDICECSSVGLRHTPVLFSSSP